MSDDAMQVYRLAYLEAKKRGLSVDQAIVKAKVKKYHYIQEEKRLSRKLLPLYCKSVVDTEFEDRILTKMEG